MKRCYLVRHAQTAWNRDDRLQGHSDVPLNPLGQQQARCLGAYFSRRHLRGIVTSQLQRSQQTARMIAAGHGDGVSPLVEAGLAEMHLGAWEGLTPAEVDGRFDHAYQRWKLSPSSVAIPEAEPLDAFRARVRASLQKIVEGMGEGEHVVVSHGGVIAAMLADVLDADYEVLIRRLRLDNAGITAVEFGGQLPHVLWVNFTGHLAPDGAPAPVPA